MGDIPALAPAVSPQRNVERLFEFMLLGMVASGYLAVAVSGYLDLPTVALMGAAIAARALLVAGAIRVRFSNALINAATLGYIGFYPLDYLFVSKEFLPATVHLVFFLAFTKILTASTDRDYSYIKVISFLELLAASLLTAGMSFFVFLTLFLVFAVGTFASAEIRRATNRPTRIARSGLKRMPLRLCLVAVFITGGILSITGGLFFVLPRTARAAFQHLVSPRYHLPGFSNQITLGQTGEIKNDSTPVMHVRFLFASHNAPRPETLKWRGVVLSQFDGQRWTRGALGPDERIPVEGSGITHLIDEGERPTRDEAERLGYEVRLTNIDTDVLFLVGVPEAVTIRAPMMKRSEAGTYRVPFVGAGALSYVAQSYFRPNGRPSGAPPRLDAQARQQYLDLPRLDPRIAELARRWTAGIQDPFAMAHEIERRLKHDYGYTLELLPSAVHDPLANFLFERRKGHCEYFASAMAVMLRTLGIPSRIATGFQSGIYNPLSGRQVIRSSDAHSWVEAYLPRRGWITFDPTPPEPAPRTAGLWTKLTLYLDAADTFWQEWVLNYDLDRQMTLATTVQNSRSNGWIERAATVLAQWRVAATDFLRRYGAPLAAALIFVALVILYGPAARNAWRLRRRLRRVQRGVVEISDATLLYARMLKDLERRGYAKPAWVTAREFVGLLPESDLTPIVDDITSLYHDLRFGGKRDAGPRMMALLAQLEKM
jgi:transglutaminase-like putative cysteine protease